MNRFKASYILNKCELLLLLSCIPDITPSAPAKYLLDHYLKDSVASQDAVEGLVYKNLAKKADGEIVIEPVVDMLVRAALSTEALWVATTKSDSLFILHSKELYLLASRYPHISDTWKITPYQTANALRDELGVQTFVEIQAIDSDGLQLIVVPDDIHSWLKEIE